MIKNRKNCIDYDDVDDDDDDRMQLSSIQCCVSLGHRRVFFLLVKTLLYLDTQTHRHRNRNTERERERDRNQEQHITTTHIKS